jgi:hypothetical protein
VGWKWLESYHETLVGGTPAPLKNMKVSWDYEIPNIWNNKKCSKPPTSSICSSLALHSKRHIDAMATRSKGLDRFMMIYG